MRCKPRTAEQRIADFMAKKEARKQALKQQALDSAARRQHEKERIKAVKIVRLIAKREYGVMSLGAEWYSPLFLEFLRSNDAQRYAMAQRLENDKFGEDSNNVSA